MTRLGAGRDDDLLGQHFFRANLDLVQNSPSLPTKAAVARSGMVTLFFLNRPLMPEVSWVTTVSLRRLHHRHVDADGLADLDAVASRSYGWLLRTVGKYAAAPWTGYSPRSGRCRRDGVRPSGRHRDWTRSKLRRNRAGQARIAANITAGTTTDNEYVELLGHEYPFRFQMCKRRQPPLTGNWRRRNGD